MAGVWIDIDLDAVISNYQEVIKYLNPGSRCMAVVKADAYGLGSVEVAKALQDEGCDAFAVTTVEEGLNLRQHGIQGLVLILGPAAKNEWKEALEADLQLTVSTLQVLIELEKICQTLDKTASIHLKLETGMGRTGFRSEEIEELAQTLKNMSYVQIKGIYTHFARAAQKDRRYTEKQYDIFQDGLEKLETLGIIPECKHVCNSAAFLDYPEWHHDFVRIGTLLIGHYPGPGFGQKLKLSDPWSAKSQIVYLKKVPKGTYVGYQSIYRTKHETQLAVIPAGYADGFGVEPHFTPQGWWDLLKIIIKNIAAFFGIFLGQERIELNGRVIKVAGKIGMQLTVLDVGLQECSLHDEVKLPIRRTLANPRVVRNYYKDGNIFSTRIVKEGFLTEHQEHTTEHQEAYN